VARVHSRHSRVMTAWLTLLSVSGMAIDCMQSAPSYLGPHQYTSVPLRAMRLLRAVACVATHSEP